MSDPPFHPIRPAILLKTEEGGAKMESKEMRNQEPTAVIPVNNVDFGHMLAMKVKWSNMSLQRLEGGAHRGFVLDQF